ncbi:MAG TPA: hypothetical protein EYN64_02000 [Flavobacteriales bacterium]|jgi:hypothetical protein|nr:hypothetical protein [Flavobacteriales bacterium]
MNIDKLNNLLDRKNENLADVRQELVELVENHPYSGPFRMLLAKASKDAGHLDQRKDLFAAAAHCESRKALFELMFGESFRKEARKIHEIIEQADEVTEEEMEEIVELVWHEKENETPSKEESDSKSEEENNIPLAREAIIEAISSSLREEMEGWGSAEKAKIDEKDEFEGGEEKKLSKNISQKSGGENQAYLGSKVEGKIIELKGRGEANSLFGKWLEKRAKETEFGEVGNVESQVIQGAGAIIDAFINKGNPSIGALRELKTPAEDWAKSSLADDPSLVTETMAKLYAQQGQIGRARKAFKMLALIYPEKSVYFASQLKKLSNK